MNQWLSLAVFILSGCFFVWSWSQVLKSDPSTALTHALQTQTAAQTKLIDVSNEAIEVRDQMIEAQKRELVALRQMIEIYKSRLHGETP